MVQCVKRWCTHSRHESPFVCVYAWIHPLAGAKAIRRLIVNKRGGPEVVTDAG